MVIVFLDFNANLIFTHQWPHEGCGSQMSCPSPTQVRLPVHAHTRPLCVSMLTHFFRVCYDSYQGKANVPLTSNTFCDPLFLLLVI